MFFQLGNVRKGSCVRAIFGLLVVAIAVHTSLYHLSKALMDVAGIVSLIFLVIRRNEILTHTTRLDWLWVGAQLLFLLAYAYSAIAFGSELDVDKFKTALRAVAIGVTVYLALRIDGSLNRKSIEFACAFNALIGGMVGVFFLFQSGMESRVTAGTNLTLIYAIVLTTCSLVALYLATQPNKTALYRVFFFASGVIGLVSTIGTQARGSWLVVSFFLALWLLLVLTKGSWFKRGLALAVAACIIVAVISIPTIQSRIELGYNEIVRYVDDAPGASNTSLGARLEMWKATMLTIMEAPIAGKGNAQLSETFQGLIDEKEVESSVGRYRHVHNNFLQIWLSSGVLGLIAISLLLAIPAYIAFKLDSQARVVLLIVVGSFALNSLTNSPFIRDVSLKFYLVLCSLLICALLQSQSSKECDEVNHQGV